MLNWWCTEDALIFFFFISLYYYWGYRLKKKTKKPMKANNIIRYKNNDQFLLVQFNTCLLKILHISSHKWQTSVLNSPIINSTYWCGLQFALNSFVGETNLWLPQINSNPLNPTPPPLLSAQSAVCLLISDAWNACTYTCAFFWRCEGGRL